MPKRLDQAKQLKKDLRKKLEDKNVTPEDRNLFGQSVRYHNYILKSNVKEIKTVCVNTMRKCIKTTFGNFLRN